MMAQSRSNTWTSTGSMTPAELNELGLEDAFGPDRITFVEWPERAPGLVPTAAIVVAISGTGDGPANSRRRRRRRVGGMNILALDAALGPFSAALDLDGRILADASDRNDALEAGLARIAALLEQAKLRLADIDRLAVGVGPGSFTGIRIALSYAKALAYGAGLPLVAISSYDVLTPAHQPVPCLAIVAGRPGVICARLTEHHAVRIACGPTATVLERLLENRPPAESLTIVANTEDVFQATGEAKLQTTARAPANPAIVIAALARTREPSPSPHGVAPDYGEVPAVTVPRAGTRIAP